MVIVLEETPTAMQKNGHCLCRRVYLASSVTDPLPVDAAPGSLALMRDGGRVETRMLFPDGVWCAI